MILSKMFIIFFILIAYEKWDRKRTIRDFGPNSIYKIKK